MRLIRCSFVLFALIEMISLRETAKAELCKPDGPLLRDKGGNPIWLDTDALVKGATHCVAPRMPALMRQARIQGQVLVDILVDLHGKVSCVQLINGHPMLAASAIDAAKEWTFRPIRKRRQVVSFYGHLSFYFSTGELPKGLNPCLVAHW